MSECETEKDGSDLSKKGYEHCRQLAVPQNAIALVGLKFRVSIILLVNKFQIKDKKYYFLESEYTYLRHAAESDYR
jgi:hypothetical protein